MTDAQRQLIDDLLVIENPQERLSAVVDRARRLPAFPEAERTEAHRVPGCVSRVWLISELRGGRCHFRCDADGPLVKSLVALLCEFYSDTTPGEITSDQADVLGELGLITNLSLTRQNGLAAVRTAIRDFAQTRLAS